MFAELMAVVGMANETNVLASGYRVEIDEQFKSTKALDHRNRLLSPGSNSSRVEQKAKL